MTTSEKSTRSQLSVSPTILPGRSYLSLVLEVPERIQRVVMDWRRDNGAEPGYPLHITVFMTELGEEPLRSAREFLRGLRADRGSWSEAKISLSGTGTFRPISDVVFLTISDGGDFLRRFHERCRSFRDSASPFLFHPHMTIAQNEDRRLLEAALYDFRHFRESFTVDRVSAYLSDSEGWSHLGDVRLASGSNREAGV